MTRRAFRWADLAVLFSVLLLGLGAWLLLGARERADTVYVYVGSDLYDTLSLSDPPDGTYAVHTPDGTLTLSFAGEGVCALHADCPDGVCVRTGVISRRGESIVCVPLGVCVTLGKGTLDGVTG